MEGKSLKFALNSDCFLIQGAKRGAVYNLSDGNIYSIDEEGVKIISECERNIPINQIKGIGQEIIVNYLNSLQDLKLGIFLNGKQTISKIEIPFPERKLQFLWLELTQICNQQCLHCYANCPRNEIRREESDNVLSLEQWQKVIKEAFTLGCRRIQFTGGEPMLFGKDIFKLIQTARELGYVAVEIFTNATLLDDEDINLLAKYNVRVATNIYSKRKEVHEKITGLKGSLGKTTTNIKKLQERGVKVFLATVLMKQNELYTKETVCFMKELGEQVPLKRFDIVRPIGRGENNEIFSEKLVHWSLKKSPIFPKLPKEEFIKRRHGHSCWWGNIAVTYNGLVLPCIMSREEVCGDIKLQSLAEILESSSLGRFWELSKDNIEVCRDCEYRYVCLDCRPLSKGGDGDLCTKVKNCLYNPYEGKWNSE